MLCDKNNIATFRDARKRGAYANADVQRHTASANSAFEKVAAPAPPHLSGKAPSRMSFVKALRQVPTALPTLSCLLRPSRYGHHSQSRDAPTKVAHPILQLIFLEISLPWLDFQHLYWFAWLALGEVCT